MTDKTGSSEQPKPPRQRQYPKFYESIVPIALGCIGIAIVVLLLITIAVALGLMPGL